MCVLIAEVLFFISGIWAIITGKVPSLVFGKKYRIEGLGARIIGVILVLPLPIAFMAGVVLSLLLGQEQGVAYATVIEIISLIVALIAALIISYRIRRPAADVEADT